VAILSVSVSDIPFYDFYIFLMSFLLNVAVKMYKLQFFCACCFFITAEFAFCYWIILFFSFFAICDLRYLDAILVA